MPADQIPSQSKRHLEPSAGVIAVAALLRDAYISEHETDAPVSDWYPEAIRLVNAYLEAEGIA